MKDEQKVDILLKLKKILESSLFSKVIFIIIILLISYIAFIFFSSSDRKTTSEDRYHTENDNKAKLLMIDLLSNRRNSLAELNLMMAKTELKEEERLEIIRDIRRTMDNNSKTYDNEINKIKKLSDNASYDVEAMRDINRMSNKYSLLLEEYIKSDNGELKKEYLEQIFEIEGRIKLTFNTFKYDDL